MTPIFAYTVVDLGPKGSYCSCGNLPEAREIAQWTANENRRSVIIRCAIDPGTGSVPVWHDYETVHPRAK